jgi:hypothetical protein
VDDDPSKAQGKGRTPPAFAASALAVLPRWGESARTTQCEEPVPGAPGVPVPMLPPVVLLVLLLLVPPLPTKLVPPVPLSALELPTPVPVVASVPFVPLDMSEPVLAGVFVSRSCEQANVVTRAQTDPSILMLTM